FLEECLKSILEQSFANFEVFLVDDDSPDPKDHVICQKFAQADPRFKYIHLEKNAGPGGARNFGIRNSTAPYIVFVDSDDILEPIALETFAEKTKASDWDVLIFSYRSIDEES